MLRESIYRKAADTRQRPQGQGSNRAGTGGYMQPAAPGTSRASAVPTPVPPKKKSAMRRALPYIIPLVSTSSAIGGMSWLIFS